MRDFALFVVLIPRNLGVLLIRGYRKLISPLYGDVCRYYPSCSAYGLGSVQQRGLVIGSLLTGWRILRCNPWSPGGIDDVRPARHDRYRVTRFGWVLPAGYVKADASAPAAHVHGASHTGHEASFEFSAQRVQPAAAAMISSPSPSRKD
ncbi:membrane protein insertion efficiency factor YidD [Agromyces sp. H3Y2-19a]|jgi:putative membrane protein insertion efficiency factor|uniref:membrane protein insertion efficiency factor YidD n=1 Tax=Agromyces TaxID=33877 RepID=UPI001E3C4137|nr:MULTISPECIES: membrane protein insertion efficiency factor YidD [Agromyces]MCD5345420.1 membrane protein insertion efficiency factor YidD [Agromyces sp. S2-1-8]MDF0515366.1 membrane protein insertion efficiency factor YidD [Agromyces chromiiresistens]